MVLWSVTSRDSDYVLEEAEYGKRKDILFPAFVERVEFPYGFGRIQTADLIDWENGEDHFGLTQLLIPLRMHLNAHDSISTPVSEPKPIAVEPKQIITPSLPAPGQTFRDRLKIGGEGPLMVVIPAGRFLMGSPENESGRFDNEGPRHEVQIAQPFAMSVYTVTFEDYNLFCEHTTRKKPDFNWGQEDRPVIDVSWYDAQNYCAWLSEQTGFNYRLPSEAEWEYAARAETTSAYYWGDEVSSNNANCNGCGSQWDNKESAPVGSFSANQYGLYDMHGNVWEWCQDTWHDNYKDAPSDGLSWEKGNSAARMLRGGCWDDRPDLARSSARSCYHPDFSDVNIGFRVLLCSPPHRIADHVAVCWG